MSSADPSASPRLLQDPDAPALVLSASPPEDPPPPYPSARRTRQNRRRRALLESSEHSHTQAPADEYDTVPTLSSPRPHHAFPDPADDTDATENTPLLSPNPASSPRSGLLPGAIRRRRTLSLTSTLRSSTSLAPSFAQTVFSAFQPERDTDLDPECREGDGADNDEYEPELDSPIPRDYDPQQRAFAAELSGYAQRHSQRCQQVPFGTRCRRYFGPLKRRAYYSALLHILVINFPYALLSWVYLFVFTLVGTCTLMALPLGAVFCFIDLLGARILSRGELALQTTFHGPLAYPLPQPPLPIFARTRPPTPAQIEAGVPADAVVPETSFYRNAYAMFTDPTSYQALFYFLVIKPGITLLMFLFFLILVPVAAALVLPLPAVLRLARRVGIWQANVAVEGLYFAAR